jgi:hypothetical protein
MMKGDFCLSPKVLVRVLIAFFLVTLALFMLGFMWGLLGPGMPMTGELILAAIFVLVLAYPVKVFLKYGGKEGALWSRVAGCLSSAMIALGSLVLGWGVGNGLPRFASVGIIALVGFFTLVFVLGSFVDTLESIPEDEE